MTSLKKNELSFFYFTMLTIALLGALASTAPAQTINHVPLYTFHGSRADVRFGSAFGSSVSGAGDVNGDGRADLIVGAPWDGNNGNRSGSARVLSGIDGTVLFNFYGDSEYDQLGFSVSGAGDVNGDGRADLIVGDQSEGAVGFPDENTNKGSARVLSGIDGSVLYNFYGDSAGDRFGFSVSGIGDVNGDGRADLFVGAPFDDKNGTESGSARVLSGIDGSVLYNFDGDSEFDRFGSSVSGAGDVNGDGRIDLIVGAPFDNKNGSFGGSTRVLSGIDGSVLYTFSGDDVAEQFGGSVSGAGDVNGDGRADLIVGVSENDNNGNDSGSARVLSGIDGSVLYTFNGDNPADRFGVSVSGVGDVNGDGRADLIVGAIEDDNNGSASGSVRVLSGIDGSVLYTFNGDNPGERFGMSVSSAGDVNGDGIGDFIVGALSGGVHGGGYARVFVSIASATGFDFDGSGEIDSTDADILQQSIVGGSTDLLYDVDGNGSIDPDDLEALVTAEAGTFIGDLDLSGAIDSTDLGLLLNSFGDTSGSLYSGGDIDADGAVLRTDLGLLLNHFGEMVAVAEAVPEPESLLLMTLAICVLVRWSRIRRRPMV